MDDALHKDLELFQADVDDFSFSSLVHAGHDAHLVVHSDGEGALAELFLEVLGEVGGHELHADVVRGGEVGFSGFPSAGVFLEVHLHLGVGGRVSTEIARAEKCDRITS